jgi:DNA-binding response OmpR family regulator
MARPHERAILVCLHKNMGFLVPYDTLCAALGYGSATAKGKHAVQQHIMTLRRLLSRHAVPYAVAAVSGAGYTLCCVRAPEDSNGGNGGAAAA